MTPSINELDIKLKTLTDTTQNSAELRALAMVLYKHYGEIAQKLAGAPAPATP